MKPGISVITLGVDDVDAALNFYVNAMGFEIGAVKGGITYLDTGGSWLCVYPREKLASYAGVSAKGSGFSGVTLSCNVDSKREVEQKITSAAAVGAEIVRPPGDVDWGGYTGWLRDPDGHLWEIVWNPRPFIGVSDT